MANTDYMPPVGGAKQTLPELKAAGPGRPPPTGPVDRAGVVAALGAVVVVEGRTPLASTSAKQHRPETAPGEHIMRATLLYGPGHVRVENVDPAPPRTARRRCLRGGWRHAPWAGGTSTRCRPAVTSSCICGSDLWPYASAKPEDGPARVGHEFIGVVEDTGSEVTTVKRGDLVVAPFAISDKHNEVDRRWCRVRGGS